MANHAKRRSPPRRGQAARAAGSARRSRRRYKGIVPTIKQSSAALGSKLIRSPLVPIIGGLVLLITILGAGLWLLTNKNAYDVYVGDEVLATIAKGKDITDKWIHDSALAKLSADLGSVVRVDREVRIEPVHRSGKLSSVEYAIGAVYKAYSESDYKLEAAEIRVNDVPIVTLRNRAEADDVLEMVMMSHAPVDVTVIEKEFVDDKVEVVSRFADSSEIESMERAVVKLTIKTETESVYQVRTGDSVWQICREHGLTQERLKELNPDVPEVANGNIRAGQLIKIITPKPLCSVRTVEEISYSDKEPRLVEQRPNNSKPKGYSKVIQEGKDGKCDVVAHVVRKNGVEIERKVVEKTITLSPVLEIIEVGTL